MNLKNLNKETIISTALMILALVNQILTIFGYSPLPIDNEFVINAISLVFLIGTTFYSWWHNNSVTSAAQIGDKIMNAIKSGKLSEENLKVVFDYMTECEKDENNDEEVTKNE